MKLRSLEEADLNGKTVLYRAPYDVETHRVGNEVVLKDLSRLEATLPTLRYLIQKNCRVVILTYVGRPEGKVVEELRTTPHAQALSEMLGLPVQKLDDCVGEVVRSTISRLSPGEIVMLENTRFHVGEMEDDDGFAQELSKNGELIIFDAFPQAHRRHASVTGIQRHLTSYAGFYCLKEVETLSHLMENPIQPFTLMIGGGKISDKVGAIKNLYDQVAHILVGGVPAHIFLKAKGIALGCSLLEESSVQKEEEDLVQVASDLLGKDNQGKIILPLDFVVNLPDVAETNVMAVSTEFPPKAVAQDIGPQTVRLFRKYIQMSQTVFWSGPMGKYEEEDFQAGSFEMMHALSNSRAQTIVAGGDTIAVADLVGVREKISVVSLAGGATLELLAGIELPGLQPLLVL